MSYTNDTKPTTSFTNDAFTAQSYFYLLMQDGSYLLQQTGDKIIIGATGGASVTYTNDAKASLSYSNDIKP